MVELLGIAYADSQGAPGEATCAGVRHGSPCRRVQLCQCKVSRSPMPKGVMDAFGLARWMHLRSGMARHSNMHRMKKHGWCRFPGVQVEGRGGESPSAGRASAWDVLSARSPMIATVGNGMCMRVGRSLQE